MAERVKNIGPRGQRTRLNGGLVTLALGVAGGVALVLGGVSRWFRLLLFFPFWQGALGVFQALNKT
jgi:hypothetical protein